MSTIRNTYRGLRLPPGLALVALGALLVCGQIVTVAHAEIDCEHERCSLCIGLASDSALIGDAAPRVTPRCQQRVEALVSSSAGSTCPRTARFIRGPPAT